MPEIKTYKKRPITVQAVQWRGDNPQEVWDFTTAEFFYGPLPVGDPLAADGAPAKLYVAANHAWLPLEVGEWIIADSKGFYPCKEDVFVATYDEVPEWDRTEAEDGGRLG